MTVQDIPLLVARSLQRPPRLSISAWAERNRFLSSDDSPETWHGNTAKAPYQVEPMNAIGDAETEEVVLMWASQTGKTAACILNALGYYISVDPGSILLVYPTIQMAERVSRQRLSPMIRNCPSLRDKIFKTTWRGMDRGSDSLLMKSYPGGLLVMGGAEKPASLSNFPMRIVLLDEVDRYKGDIGEEGDPVELAISRAQNFWNRKVILASTPTLTGASRIEFAYENSSQGRWHLPCPECCRRQELKWHQIDYTNFGEHVLCKCAFCQAPFSKPRWLAGTGQWIHAFPERKVRGYALNALPSPWVSWHELAEKWKLANEAKHGGNRALLKVFINTKLAETYNDYVGRVEPHILTERREVYPAEVPDGVLVLTVGADIQDIQKRINYEVVGWGKDYESWGIEYGSIFADPREKDWHELFDQLVYNRIFKFADGRGIRVRRGLIDANGAVGPYIYAYTRRRQPRIYSSKGSGHEQAISKSFTGEYKIDLKYNTTWFPINTVMGKDELFERLQVLEPGAGYCHFPVGEDGEDVRGYSDDYFRGLTSEQKHEETDNRGYTVYKYRKEGASHRSGEPLDCRNYARAALELVEQTRALARMTEPDYLATQPEPPALAPAAHGMSVVSSVPLGKVDDGLWKTPEEMGEKHQPKSAWPLAAKLGQPGSRPLKNFDPYRDD
jgi:phage terminase large subunit GpA-like protein